MTALTTARHDTLAAGKSDVTRQAEARDWAGAASSWVHALVLEIADAQNRWTASLMHGGRADWAPGGPLTCRLHSAMRSAVAACSGGMPLIAAWGANARPDRVDHVLRLPGMVALHALGVTKDGAPRHPLYLRADSESRPWCPRKSS